MSVNFFKMQVGSSNGETDFEVIRNTVLAYLSEKGYLEKG